MTAQNITPKPNTRAEAISPVLELVVSKHLEMLRLKVGTPEDVIRAALYDMWLICEYPAIREQWEGLL